MKKKAFSIFLIFNVLFFSFNITAQIIVTQSAIKGCEGQEISFSPIVSGGSGSYIFSWSGPDNFTSKIISPSISNVNKKNAGKYKLEVKDIIDTTLKVVSDVEVKYFELPKKGEIKSSIAGDNIFLGVFIDKNKLSYTWTSPNGTTQKGITFLVSNAKLSDLGEYKLKILDSTSGCVNTFSQIVSNLPKQEAIDSSHDELRYWASIGGNLDFANTNIRVNSVYTDLQFNGKIRINNIYHIQFPMRIYYNNGTGIKTVESNRQRFTTIDTITYYKEKKYKYWIDTPNIKSKTESQNFGLNLPISLYRKISNSDWFLTAGVNLDFALTTNRQFDYEYSNSDSTLKFNVVDDIRKVPIYSTNPNYNTGVIRLPYLYYGTSNFRPELITPDREWQYFQFYFGAQLGVAYEAKDIDFFLKYSWGTNTTFVQQQNLQVPYFNHIIQTRFIERKKLGIQIFIDLRMPKILSDGTSSAFPYYYVSIAKLINLDALSKLFATK